MKHMSIKDLIQVFVIDAFNPGIYTSCGIYSRVEGIDNEYLYKILY